MTEPLDTVSQDTHAAYLMECGSGMFVGSVDCRQMADYEAGRTGSLTPTYLLRMVPVPGRSTPMMAFVPPGHSSKPFTPKDARLRPEYWYRLIWDASDPTYTLYNAYKDALLAIQAESSGLSLPDRRIIPGRS